MALRALRLLAIALWLGGGAALMFIAAPAAFSGSPTPTTAAAIVGTILTKWHYIAIIVPLFLLIFEWYGSKLARTARVVWLCVALLGAAAQALVDLRIREIRTSSRVAISELRKSDPVRKRFGLLHGVSMALMLMQLIAATGVVVEESREGDERTGVGKAS